jgi:hypothetical protein
LKCGFQKKVCASKSPTFFSRKTLALTLKDDTTANKRTKKKTKCQRFAKLKELFSLPQADPKQHI